VPVEESVGEINKDRKLNETTSDQVDVIENGVKKRITKTTTSADWLSDENLPTTMAGDYIKNFQIQRTMAKELQDHARYFEQVLKEEESRKASEKDVVGPEAPKSAEVLHAEEFMKRYDPNDPNAPMRYFIDTQKNLYTGMRTNKVDANIKDPERVPKGEQALVVEPQERSLPNGSYKSWPINTSAEGYAGTPSKVYVQEKNSTKVSEVSDARIDQALLAGGKITEIRQIKDKAFPNGKLFAVISISAEDVPSSGSKPGGFLSLFGGAPPKTPKEILIPYSDVNKQLQNSTKFSFKGLDEDNDQAPDGYSSLATQSK